MELGTKFPAKLEPFLLMAKSMKGAAAAKLIQDATSAPGVFVFAELLDLPNILELEKSEQHRKFLSLLQLFAYRTYQDYLQHKDELPPLNQAQIIKLKHLSIVSMATEKRILPYSDLLKALDMPTVRELEDLIIDAIYLDILRGKLDQKEGQLEVEYTMGRDLEPGKLESVLSALQDWASATSSVLATLDSKIVQISSETTAAKKRQDEYELALQSNLKEVSEKNASTKGSSNSRRTLLESNMRMDVDAPAYELTESKGKNRKAPQENPKPLRKRNRF
ncbi:related to COP9 signalosome complex subunit 7b [Armillaria ostoyae]|uniref:Related to COP9 signalosome complex subunit 7b n=1 Tax=Armillaria ostoyae TaxID=47428 RepID=A0A284QVY5_ARMOS|nr:related to COP9 signalosome complex subunit 7b [Armillaria ostoyae]